MKKQKSLIAGAVLAVSLGFHATDGLAAASAGGLGKCRTIGQSGSYALTGNLNASGDCLVLAADFVSIDLNGFTIFGNGTGSAIRSDGAVRTGITVRNGTITNFETGIDFGVNGIQVMVERMNLVGNSNIGVGANDLCIVKDSLFYQNGDGMNVGSRCVVTGNTSNYNTHNGIVVNVGSTITGNTADLNGNIGIYVGNGSTVVNNTALGNTNFGIYATCASNLIGNTATLNGTNLSLQGAGCSTVNNLTP